MQSPKFGFDDTLAARDPAPPCEPSRTPVAGEPLAAQSIPVETLPQHYDVAPGFHNLENGYWGVMPRYVAQAYAEHTAYVNRYNSAWARNALPGDASLHAKLNNARAVVADWAGVAAEEIALTRSGSEALEALILNYKGLQAGDALIYCDLDYDSCIDAMEQAAKQRGAEIVRFHMPVPATTANILAAYEEVLERTPNAKLLLVTQVSHRTGLILPVREIVTMARDKGVDAIVDLAHGAACLDVRVADLGCDFAGWSLHKWASAPLGTGAMYIRRHRIADVTAAYDNHEPPADGIAARVPGGRVNFAAMLSIPAAAAFHHAVGGANKEQHLRSLRNRWVSQVRDLPGLEICVPDDPERFCVITSFRLQGMRTAAQAQQLQDVLFHRYRVLTVWRDGGSGGPVIRVTPGMYSTEADCDALARALQAEHAMFH